MKKLLLTLIVSLAFGGAVFAQGEHLNPNGYESHWADLTIDPFLETYDCLISFFKIDGEMVTLEDNWADLEIAAFVNGQLRGTAFMDYVQDYENDWVIPYPFVELNVKRTSTGETVDFVLYDHVSGVEYTSFTCNYDYVTGDDHYEIYWAWEPEEYDDGFTLDFATPEGITKNIIGYLNGGGWYFISSPVGEINVTGVQNLALGTFDLYYFNQEGDGQGNEWMNYEMGEGNDPGFTTLEPGKGYLYANEGDVTLTFPNNPYDGEGTFELEYSENNPKRAMRGWNLMGNPFNETVTVDRPFYRMVGDEYEEHPAGDEIDPMEGVLVYTNGQETESVTFAAPTGGKNPMLALSVSNGSKVLDRAIIGFGQGNSLPKLQFNPNSTKVYITMDNEDYAVVRSEGMGEMPVSFKAESNGAYSLNLSSESVDFAYLHLIDNLTGADQDLLANPSYSFEAKTTDYASRFSLVFATGNNDDSFAFFSNGNLVVSNEGNATLQVVDITGRILMSETINGSASVNFDAAPGVYMVRLINGDNMMVQKVVK